MYKYGDHLISKHNATVCTDMLSAPATEQKAPVTPCFTAGALIKTDEGEVAAEDIRPGMRVLTRDNGYQPVIWASQRHLEPSDLEAHPHLVPICIRAGALAPSVPQQDLHVSPQHRILLSNTQIRKWFQSDEVLIAAEHMLCYPNIEQAEPEAVLYIHFMFRQHEIVLADGCWSESFQPTDMSIGAMGDAQRREILELFPELAVDADAYKAARITVDPAQASEVLNSVLNAAKA